MQNKERPLSPHISIYKPQITSVMSILHRISGSVLFLGLIIISWIIICSIFKMLDKQPHIISSLKGCMIAKIAIIAWLVALYYHFLNGIRHLFWDIGKGYDLKIVTRTGIIVLVVTAILTYISFHLAFNF
jgi:succinate dehydrogenase / fumarate reductase, cytochrome b subunit